METYYPSLTPTATTFLPQHKQEQYPKSIQHNNIQHKQQQDLYNSMLHSTRKPPAKPWKKPIAPMPRTPPRIYKVDPVNFKNLVQKLTGANHQQKQQPQQTKQRLQNVAPSPLILSGALTADVALPLPSPSKSTFISFYQDIVAQTVKPDKGSDTTLMGSSFLELNLSPSSFGSWCSFPLASPGTL